LLVNDSRTSFVAQQINGEKYVEGVTLVGEIVGIKATKKFGQ
jgi:hypothetical protein